MCEIANKISRRRKELGLTLEDVGKAVGVGRSTVQRWESGMIKNMGRDKIVALARVLQISPVELVSLGEDALTRIKIETQEASDKMAEFKDRLGIKDYPSRLNLQMYASDEDLGRLEALHQNPRLGLLFDRSSKLSPEDIEFMLQMADRMIKERDD